MEVNRCMLSVSMMQHNMIVLHACINTCGKEVSMLTLLIDAVTQNAQG